MREGKKVNPHIGLIPLFPNKLFLDHFQFRKSKEGPEIAKPFTRILLTWVAEAGLRPLNFHPQRKQWEKRQFRSCAVMVLKIIENF